MCLNWSLLLFRIFNQAPFSLLGNFNGVQPAREKKSPFLSWSSLIVIRESLLLLTQAKENVAIDTSNKWTLTPGTCTLQHCLVIVGYHGYVGRAEAARGAKKGNRIFVGSAWSHHVLFHFVVFKRHSEGRGFATAACWASWNTWGWVCSLQNEHNLFCAQVFPYNRKGKLEIPTWRWSVATSKML